MRQLKNFSQLVAHTQACTETYARAGNSSFASMPLFTKCNQLVQAPSEDGNLFALLEVNKEFRSGVKLTVCQFPWK